MSKYSVGCKELRIGAIGALGVMGTSLAAYSPYKNTVKITEADPTKTPHFGENKRYPDVVVVENGATEIAFEIHDLSKANLAKFLGGTAAEATEKWEAGTDHFQIEQSVEIDTVFEETWQYPRVMLTGTIKWDADRANIARIAVSGMILQPEGADTLPISKIPTPA